MAKTLSILEKKKFACMNISVADEISEFQKGKETSSETFKE